MAKLNPESAWEFADAIKSIVRPQTTRRKATVQNIDKDGTIWVQLPGSSQTTPIQSTGANVSPGDTVLTELRGTSLHITENQTNPAIGENTARSIARNETRNAENMARQARTIADEAQAVANATNQHFWDDTNGAHVTDVTQDEWNAAVADNFSDYDPTTKPYHNQLLNSLGILLRTALNNLVSITRSAIAFYDGTGNAASNIVARFGTDGAQIGASGAAHMSMNQDELYLFNENGVSFFNVDMDAGAAIEGDAQTAKMSNAVSYSYVSGTNTKRVTCVSGEFTGVVTGSSLRLPANEPLCQVLVTQTNLPDIPDFHTISQGTNLRVVSSGNRAKVYPANEWTLTAGTAITAREETVKIRMNKTEGNATVDFTTALTVRFMYDGGNTYSVRTTAVTTMSSGTVAGKVYTYAPGLYYKIATRGAAFTFGTRGNSAFPGILSSTHGEGLIASQANQSAFGRYNAEDTNGDYALIIGNGTADDARSNALAVTWDGDIEAAGDVYAANNTGAYVNLASYTSASSAYVFPSNGYVFTYNAANASSLLTIKGATDSGGTIAIGAQNARESLYVRKGMKCYVTGTFSAVRFTPLTR